MTGHVTPYAMTPAGRPVREVVLEGGESFGFSRDAPGHVWVSVDGHPLYVAGGAYSVGPVVVPWRSVSFIRTWEEAE